MGRTYHPRNGVAPFDVNVAGAQALGWIAYVAGCHSKVLERHDRDIARRSGIEFWNVFNPSTRFKPNKREVLLHARRIRAMMADAVLMDKAFAHCRRLVESRKAFDWLVLAWAEFLEKCGGYEVMG